MTPAQQAKFDRVCELVAGGMSVNKACEEDGTPSRRTFYLWLEGGESELLHSYARALETRTELQVEEIIEIADDTSRDKEMVNGVEVIDHEHIARSRLRVDARKWTASKMLPKKYGDKIQQEHTGPNGADLRFGITFVKPGEVPPPGDGK